MSRVIRNKAIVRHLIKVGVIANQRDLGNKMGYSNESSFSQVLNGRVAEPKDFIPKLKSIMPDLNVNWLLYGEGSMLNVQPAVISPYPIDDAEIVGECSRPQLHSDTRPLTPEECELCPAKLPYVKGELVQSRNVNIRELIQNDPHKLEYRSMKQMIGNPDYVQKVITEAMMPTFQPGDLLFIQFLPVNAKIISGAIYLVDTALYGAMVRQVFVEEDCYVLHSKNPEYKELTIIKKDIYSFALVLHSLRSDFKISSTVPDAISVFKRREDQLERLLAMNEDAMAEIRRQNERMAEERHRQDAERKEQLARQDELIKIITRQYNN